MGKPHFKSIKDFKTLKDWQGLVDGEVNTWYELFILLVIVINTISLGIETSKTISEEFRTALFWIDQICLYIFVAELIFKIIVYNKNFFGTEQKDEEDGKSYFNLNKWNISDLIIVAISLFSSLSYITIFRAFQVFRSFKVIKTIKSLRAVKSFKIVNEFSGLRSTFKGLIKAIPGILWTFCFLAIFAYVYAIIGTNIFYEEFPQFFGSLGTSILSLYQITTFDAWFSGIARSVMKVYPWAWIYFISYAFIAASVIMNVIVGIIVDSMGKERDKENAKNNTENNKNRIILEDLSRQVTLLQKQIDDLTRAINGK